MLDKNNMPEEFVTDVKRHLQITWNDPDTTESLISMMLDGEIELNHLFGAELDYAARAWLTGSISHICCTHTTRHLMSGKEPTELTS